MKNEKLKKITAALLMFQNGLYSFKQSLEVLETMPQDGIKKYLDNEYKKGVTLEVKRVTHR